MWERVNCNLQDMEDRLRSFILRREGIPQAEIDMAASMLLTVVGMSEYLKSLELTTGKDR